MPLDSLYLSQRLEHLIAGIGRRILAGAMLFLLSTDAALRAADPQPPVTLTEDDTTAKLDNGIVSATIRKANGNLLSLRFHGVEMISRGGGYMNCYGNSPGQAKTDQKPMPSVFRISQNPAQTGGALGEVTLQFPYHGQANSVPLDIEIRYTLRRGEAGLYAWTVIDHDAKSPPFVIEAGTICLKLNPEVFDYLSIDSRRQREMATGLDWVKGTQLNLKEARRLNTGIHAGEVEHKYDYSAILAQTPAYGWSSSAHHVGLWMIHPSFEFINGGPVKVDLTGHIDIKSSLPADPTLLSVWHSLHYGGQFVPIGAGEHWRKVVGPVFLYCNGGETHDAMWRDALARAAQEKKEWPYAWAEAPGYEHAAERGSASGRLLIRDPQAPKASAAGAWVGLAAAPYPGPSLRGSPITIDWQADGKHYEYWARADADGRFTIPNARPGAYTLYAFTDGVLGDFSRADVHVEAGQTTDLGDLAWTPVRYGRQLWEIGVPDRSAGEFRHGDHYWQWGLYQLYPQAFPHDVDFVIGQSDWRRDWNYAQPPRPDGKGGWTSTTWRIRFNVDHALKGTATLRLAICGVRGGPIDVALNDQPIGSTGELPESSVLHRDGIRGALLERNVKFAAALLRPGMNVIALTKHARDWTEGVLYDYLRLEVDEGK